MWTVNINLAGMSIPVLKKIVDENTGNKTHGDVLGKFLSEATWLHNGRGIDVAATPVTVSYYSETFKEWVEMGLSEKVVPGRKYRVEVGEVPSTSQSQPSTSGVSLDGID